MKHNILGATVLVASLSSLGCGQANEARGEHIASTSQAVTCATNQGFYPVAAALAVAMANEMGEIDALKNLTVVDGKVAISAAGRALCIARHGCANTEGLLAMQDDSLRNYIDQNVFNPTSFRETLKASFDRQRNHEQNLAMNYPTKVPEAATFTLIGTVNNPNACGTHYEFDAAKSGCTGSNCRLDHPANQVNRLMFFGLGQDGTSGNPFIAFYSADAGIAIDPPVGLNATSDTGIGYVKVDPSGASLGATCSYGSVTGTWKPAPWSAAMVYCAS